VKLAEALDDRASFRRFCGFSSTEATSECTAFVRFRKLVVAQGLDGCLFEAAQLKAKAITVKTGTLIDATIITSAREEDSDGRWAKHRGRKPAHGFKAHVGAGADTALVERISVTPANVNDGRAGPEALPDDPGEVFADSAPIADRTSAMPFVPRAVRRGLSRPVSGPGMNRKHRPGSKPGTNQSIASAAGSRRSSARGTKLRPEPDAEKSNNPFKS